MGCQCNSMHRCRQDINRVEDLRDQINSANQANARADSCLSSLASGVQGALNSANSSEFASAIRKINDTFADALPQLARKCDTQIASLKSSYNAMQAEDLAFHAASS